MHIFLERLYNLDTKYKLMIWFFGVLTSLLLSINYWTTTMERPVDKALMICVQVILAITPIFIFKFVKNPIYKYGLLAILIIFSVVASSSILVNQANKIMNESYKNSEVYQNQLASKDKLEDAVHTHRMAITTHQESIKGIESSIKGIESQKSDYATRRQSEYNSFPSDYITRKRNHSADTQKQLDKYDELILAEQQKILSVNNKIANEQKAIVELQKKIAVPIEIKNIGDTRATSGNVAFFQTVANFLGMKVDNMILGFTVFLFIAFELIIMLLSWTCGEKLTDSDNNKKTKTEKVDLKKSIGFQNPSPAPSMEQDEKPQAKIGFATSVKPTVNVSGNPSEPLTAVVSSGSEIVKSDYKKYFDIMYNPEHQSGENISAGYQKIGKLSGLGRTKADKIKGTLEMLDIVESRNGRTYILKSKSDALKIIKQKS